jgi:hypothetical protein
METHASTDPHASRPLRVLALDGGGIRGYYTAQVLAGLLASFEKQRGGVRLDLGKGFDLIAGTSTGGILAAGLAVGKSPGEIAQLYRQSGPEIFPRRFVIPKGIIRKIGWIARYWSRPVSSQSALEKGLTRVFGDDTLSDVWLERVIALAIPAVSIENYGPKVFKTPHARRFTHDPDLRLVDVCLATSAAPLFFPLHPINKAKGYFQDDLFVDGGLWANNPSLVGLIEAIEIISLGDAPGRPIRIFSLGTCAGPVDQSHLKSDSAGGLKTWNAGKDVTELTLATSANAVDAMAGLLAHSLTALGIPITYVRLLDPEMNSKQHAALGMDKADDEAFRTMDSLASTNQVRILSGMKDDPRYQLFGEILRTLPEVSGQSGATHLIRGPALL